MKGGRVSTGGIAVVVLIQQFVGFIWYSPFLFGNLWLDHIGKSVEVLKRAGLMPYLISTLGAILLCYILSKLIYAADARTANEGLKLGFLCWLGFVLPATAVHYVFAGQSLELILIDSGHFLVNLCLAGTTLAAMRID